MEGQGCVTGHVQNQGNTADKGKDSLAGDPGDFIPLFLWQALEMGEADMPPDDQGPEKQPQGATKAEGDQQSRILPQNPDQGKIRRAEQGGRPDQANQPPGLDIAADKLPGRAGQGGLPHPTAIRIRSSTAAPLRSGEMRKRVSWRL